MRFERDLGGRRKVRPVHQKDVFISRLSDRNRDTAISLPTFDEGLVADGEPLRYLNLTHGTGGNQIAQS